MAAHMGYVRPLVNRPRECWLAPMAGTPRRWIIGPAYIPITLKRSTHEPRHHQQLPQAHQRSAEDGLRGPAQVRVASAARGEPRGARRRGPRDLESPDRAGAAPGVGLLTRVEARRRLPRRDRLD